MHLLNGHFFILFAHEQVVYLEWHNNLLVQLSHVYVDVDFLISSLVTTHRAFNALYPLLFTLSYSQECFAGNHYGFADVSPNRFDRCPSVSARNFVPKS